MHLLPSKHERLVAVEMLSCTATWSATFLASTKSVAVVKLTRNCGVLMLLQNSTVDYTVKCSAESEGRTTGLLSESKNTN